MSLKRYGKKLVSVCWEPRRGILPGRGRKAETVQMCSAETREAPWREHPGMCTSGYQCPSLGFPKGSALRSAASGDPGGLRLASGAVVMLVLTVAHCCLLPSLRGSPRFSGWWVKVLFPSRRSRERGEAAGHVGGAEGGGRGRAEGL